MVLGYLEDSSVVPYGEGEGKGFELSPEEETELKLIANGIRRDIVQMTYMAKSGHPGGSLSAVEIMVSLYWRFLSHRPHEPWWEGRDRFVLSKGHACPVLYACLAARGYFPKDMLWTFRKLGSILQGHPEYGKAPGIEATTGSLGQGFGVAVGMALAFKLDRRPNRVYVLVGDGEIQEGCVWESAMTASFRGLDNLTAILDHNGLQIDGAVREVKGSLYPLREKWEAFGWKVVEADGHSFRELFRALGEAVSTRGVPTLVIAHTVKGKGVSFMEGNVSFHGKPPTASELEEALRELADRERAIREGRA